MADRAKKNIFIGVAWPYVNGELHVGHLAGYLIPADIFARFHRLAQNNVLMASGSDCYGTPITIEAEKKNIPPEEVVALYHPKHKNLFDFYCLSFDIYTKTTTKNHEKAVQEVFLRLARKGYIFKQKSLQYFDAKEKRFLPDRYLSGTCPFCGFDDARGDQCDKCGKVLEQGQLASVKSRLSGRRVVLKQTEHYYFDLPKLERFLKKYVKEKGGRWRKWVLKETQAWLKKGLEPRCITRDISWGVKIPAKSLPAGLRIKGVSQKRIYVWFEAVIGYLSASIEWAKGTKNWQDFWYSEKNTEHYYFMGKDNLVFHTLFWPAQIKGSYPKMRLPDFPAINHFLNLEGQKFSKSRNIIVDSKYIGQKYGVDPVRFYITSIMPENADANFSWAHFAETNNNVLIANLGNLINRILTMSLALPGFSEKDLDKQVCSKTKAFLEKAGQQVSDCQFKAFCQTIVKIGDWGNKYLEKKSPWHLDKTSKEFKDIMTNALFIVLGLDLALKPLIPTTCGKIEEMLGIEIKKWPQKHIVKYLRGFLPQIKIKNPQPLFDKIPPEAVEKERAKLNIS